MTFILPLTDLSSISNTSNQQPQLQAQTQAQAQLQPLQQHQPYQRPVSPAHPSGRYQQPLGQPLQHHQPLAMNGVNGANMAAGGGVGAGAGGGGPSFPTGPTPAGHQAELNYIYAMVEELSRQLADNRRMTEDIVSGLGKVRNRAKSQGLSNDELIGSAAAELQAENQDLDTLVSILSEALEKATFSRDANATLLSQYANALALMLKQFHEYKFKHVADVASWHRSYRSQLDEARQENSRLREQIWEMKTHAGRANENLRQFRRKYDEDEKRWDRRVDRTAMRQQLRFWKRMAMPELDDDDPYWSGDDDMIDSSEKQRLRELEQRAAQEQMMEAQMEEDGEGGPGGQMATHLSMMGGIAMQREESAGRAMPVPPPRPSSAASSTGSTGQ
ncbi:hypothetical protein QQS21_005080 [Conoideocrella luteorostrata]|uniref:Uncharacterized protein n=1 Tax=Conoideocrella luteorostrata TaxID=1105319 RepID=A0AAJ0CQC0_9HYPO|nr:hypothetical protein QQS21_005080 [Conoideocrella luteorostrata]